MERKVAGLILLVLMFLSSISFSFLQGFTFTPQTQEINKLIVEGKNATQTQIFYLLNKGKTVVIYEIGYQDKYYPEFKRVVFNGAFGNDVVVFAFNSTIEANKVTVISLNGEVSVPNVTLDDIIDLVCVNLIRPTEYCVLRKL